MFGRFNPHFQKRQGNEETSAELTFRATENDAGPSLIEARRRDEGRPCPGVQKSGTSPQGNTGEKEPENVTSGEHSSEGSSKKPLTNLNTPTDQEPSLDNNRITESEGDEEGVPREQKLGKSLTLWNKAEDDNPHLQRTISSGAQAKKYIRRLPVAYQLKAVLWHPVSLLFAFVPAGFAVYYTHQNAATVFVLNFLAIVPSNVALMFAIAEFSKYVGDKLEGLLPMTFR